MTLHFLWETFIYCSLSPATFLSQPRPTFSLTFSWTSSPGFSVDSSNLAYPRTAYSSLQPPIRQTDRQTPHSFTGSPHPPRLHHYPPKLSIIPESFPPSAYAHIADPLNISLTNLSSLTLRLQPQSGLPYLLSRPTHHYPTYHPPTPNASSTPSRTLNAFGPFDSHNTLCSHPPQNQV